MIFDFVRGVPLPAQRQREGSPNHPRAIYQMHVMALGWGFPQPPLTAGGGYPRLSQKIKSQRGPFWLEGSPPLKKKVLWPRSKFSVHSQTKIYPRQINLNAILGISWTIFCRSCQKLSIQRAGRGPIPHPGVATHFLLMSKRTAVEFGRPCIYHFLHFFLVENAQTMFKKLHLIE